MKMENKKVTHKITDLPSRQTSADKFDDERNMAEKNVETNNFCDIDCKNKNFNENEIENENGNENENENKNDNKNENENENKYEKSEAESSVADHDIEKNNIGENYILSNPTQWLEYFYPLKNKFSETKLMKEIEKEKESNSPKTKNKE